MLKTQKKFILIGENRFFFKMTAEEFKTDEEKNKKKRNDVLVGIPMNSQSREVLSWALVKVAQPGDSVIAIHVCPSPGHALKEKPTLDDYLDVYQGLCSVKKVELIGKIMTGSSVRRVLVREAKNYAAIALVLGISKQTTLGISTAKYCAKRLSSTTDVVAVHNGKIVFRRCSASSRQLPGLKGDPRPSLAQSELGDNSDVETETVVSACETIQNLQDSPGHGSDDSRSGSFISRSDSLLSTDFCSMDQRLGWPLLKRSNLVAPKGRNVSVVQWVMSLPDRSPLQTLHCSTILENYNMETEVSDTAEIRLSAFSEAPEGLQHLLQTSSFGCKYWFSLEVLKNSTCQFSPENLIGKGGCNCVYKGTLPNRKLVAVKLLNSSKEGWKEFALEFDIVSSVKHKHIARLLGVCVEDNALISVYDFFPKGSLEENLHGKKGKGVLSWEMRYNIALGIAEALHYLHKECPQPVIHRDIKSSNILLSDGLEPKLSDFGLAMWGPKTSSFLIEGDVVGTFGYLAPEYFMYGKVGDKIDVYSFGVVLLELLSGRRPISSDSATSNGQESLVMWAKPIIESGDVKGILDPNLDGKVDELQMKRVALAAALCITQSARLRPCISEILKLLKGDEDVKKWTNSGGDYQQDSENQDDKDDEVYPKTSAGLHLGVALLDVVDDDTTSFSSSTERSHGISLEEYFKGRRSRSPSFD